MDELGINKSERNYGIDILRMLSMFFVLILHVGGFIFLDNYTSFSINSTIGWFIEYLAIVAVNCFVLITGYLHGGGGKYSSLVRLWFEVFFYSFVLTIVAYFFYNRFHLFMPISKINILNAVFPVFRNQYWFFTEYFGLMILTPVLNAFVQNIGKDKLSVLLLVLFFCFSVAPTGFITDAFNLENGYSTIWFLYLYLCGSYIKINRKKFTNKLKYLFIYIGTALLSTIARLFLNYSNLLILGHNVNQLGTFVSNYNQPLVFISSIWSDTIKVQCQNCRKCKENGNEKVRSKIQRGSLEAVGRHRTQESMRTA